MNQRPNRLSSGYEIKSLIFEASIYEAQQASVESRRMLAINAMITV
jgi:hypothetical protein